MVNWVIVGIIIGTVFLFFKFTAFKYEKIWTYTMGALFAFVLYTFFSVVSRNQLDISNFNGFISSMEFYVQWLWGFISHTATVTGNAIKVDYWTGNFTNLTGIK